MNNRAAYLLLFLTAVWVSSVCQLILKKSAERRYENKIREYLNVPVLTAYSLFFLATLLTAAAYQAVPLSMGPVLEATGYIWVAILGRIFLKERLSGEKLIGLGFIISGIIIFNWEIF